MVAEPNPNRQNAENSIIGNAMQTAIPCLFMRGGTSRGPFFNAADLPADIPTRDKVLLAVMGSPDKRQIDGLGGAHPLTSKVGIVSKGSRPGVDLDFLFAQLQPDKDTVDTTPNCGNMLAAVVPFALETGLVKPQGDTTTLRVLTLNTDMQCDITVQTPNGHVEYEGKARIDGAPGFETRIDAVSGKANTPVTVVQWIRFGAGSTAIRVIGSAPPDQDQFPRYRGLGRAGTAADRECERRDRRHHRDLHRQRHAAGDLQG